MYYMYLQLDSEALSNTVELLDGIENENGWLKMTARLAAQIDSKLKASGYAGRVTWFSEKDYIEHDIDYS
ncbi:hypothetical protein RCJ22_25865 [Vibrio sp. FNV 38]|nr:hypothetical protein [Vibrio sp. FNV 38]